MAKQISNLVIALWALGIIADPAQAEAVTYTMPKVEGERLSACAYAGPPCGKAVANRFCEKRDFQRALTFKFDPSPYEGGRLRTVDGRVAPAEQRKAFQFIKCYSPREIPTLVEFSRPEEADFTDRFTLQVDGCEVSDPDCQLRAARNWCVTRGFKHGAATYLVDIAIDQDGSRLLGGATIDEHSMTFSFAKISCNTS